MNMNIITGIADYKINILHISSIITKRVFVYYTQSRFACDISVINLKEENKVEIILQWYFIPFPCFWHLECLFCIYMFLKTIKDHFHVLILIIHF